MALTRTFCSAQHVLHLLGADFGRLYWLALQESEHGFGFLMTLDSHRNRSWIGVHLNRPSLINLDGQKLVFQLTPGYNPGHLSS